MKQIKGKIDFVVIPIPKDITWWLLEQNDPLSFISQKLGLGHNFLSLGKEGVAYYDPNTFYCLQDYGHAEIIGKLSEITEQECSLFVETLFDKSYRDYSESGIGYESFPFETAKESLVSLLKANGCWTTSMIAKWNKGDNFRDDPSPLEGTGITPDDFLIIKIQ